jgi:hypothetical protein
MTTSDARSPNQRMRRLIHTAHIEVIPRLAARQVKGERELIDFAARLDELGIHTLYVIGGDGVGIGDNNEASEILEALTRRSNRSRRCLPPPTDSRTDRAPARHRPAQASRCSDRLSQTPFQTTVAGLRSRVSCGEVLLAYRRSIGSGSNKYWTAASSIPNLGAR